MPDYTFTKNWFEQNAGYWDGVRNILKQEFGDNLTCVEVGTFEGRSAIYILDNLVGDTGKLFVLDQFASSHADTFERNIALNPRSAQVKTMKGDFLVTMPALLSAIGETAHFVYVDAGKTAAENAAALIFAERMLVHRGIMIIDDYIWANQGDPRLRPSHGINAFAGMTLLCEELAVPRTQAAFRKIRNNAYLSTLYA